MLCLSPNSALTATLTAVLALSPALVLACDRPGPPVFDGGASGGVSVSVGRIADVTWEPRLIDGKPVPAKAGLSLSVGLDGTVAGTTGCNRLSGTAAMDAGELVFGPLAVTERACLEPDRNAREAAYLQALGEVKGFVVAPEGLWLLRQDGSVAICLG